MLISDKNKTASANRFHHLIKHTKFERQYIENGFHLTANATKMCGSVWNATTPT